MAKCIYCGKRIKQGLPVIPGKRKTSKPYLACSETCRHKAERFFHFSHYLTIPGLLVIAISLLPVFSGALGFTEDRRFLGAGLALLGLFYTIYPLSNRYAAENVGLKKSRIATRICACAAFFIGVFVLLEVL